MPRPGAPPSRPGARRRRRRSSAPSSTSHERPQSGPARITICSPQPLADTIEEAWAYGDRVPVQISIRGLPEAARTALGATPGPLLLTLNGVRLRIDGLGVAA